MKRVIKRLIKLVVFSLLLFAAFYNSSAFAVIYPAPVSLRYIEPLTKTQVESALEYVQSEQNNADTYPTFWLQKEGVEVTTRDDTKAITQILVGHGQGELIWPATFILGGWPGVYDEDGCAVSAQLAWNLWGSTDVVGKEVQLDKRKLTVRGIFEGEDPILYATGGLDVGYTCVELSPIIDEDKHEAAENFIIKAGLPFADYMVYGGSMQVLMQAACWLEVIYSALCLMWHLFRACPPKRRRLMLLCLLFVLAFLLPVALSELPAWIIPTRLSDFDFWGRLWQTVSDRIREWFSLPAQSKDVMAKFLMLKQGILSVGLMLLAVSLMRKEGVSVSDIRHPKP